MSPGAAGRSAWRRLGVCLAVLAAVDQAVLPILRRSEAAHYETAAPSRFGNSDIFGLGPLVQYLDEHPAGRRPRVAFLGNSMVWGYQVEAWQTIPAAFQSLTPGRQVLNLGINGFTNASALLVTKALTPSVDVFYLVRSQKDDPAFPLLPKLIPVSDEDRARFGLAGSTRLQERLHQWLRFWRLPTHSYRLQAAWFGTSTRQWLYLLVRNAAKPPVPPGPLPSVNGADARWDAPEAPGRVSAEDAGRLAQEYPVLWDFAAWLTQHHKRGAILQYWEEQSPTAARDRALFNAVFGPSVVWARMEVPPDWRMHDEAGHFTPAGAAGIAQLLRAHTSQSFGLD